MSQIPFFKREFEPQNFDLYHFLKRHEGHTFVFLESCRKSEEDQQSLFFTNPLEVLVLTEAEALRVYFRRLEEALKQGFWLAGFFTYECGYLLEPRLKKLFRRPQKTPLAWFGVFESPKVLPAGAVKYYDPPRFEILAPQLNLGKEEYVRRLREIKHFIAQGDTYQVNFTLKYHFRVQASAVDLYLALRPKQKVRYAGLIHTPSFSVVSLSPELFIRRQGQALWTSPMKGTAPRGRFNREDEEIALWLQNDPKNQAENIMIVDLLRNDLGRVCIPGSVYVRELFKVERYETVFQMISTVEGELATEDLYALFRALFPCGSVTGAPKVRTMEIIAALETESRGVYTGALGYFSPQGDLVFNVPIRTVVLKGDRGEFGLGSGVVWDSDPQGEYEECLLKARFLFEAYKPFALVETMLFTPEEGFPLLAFHLERLAHSAAYFGFSFPEQEIRRLLRDTQQTLERPAKVRLLLREDGHLRLEAYPLEGLSTPVKIALAQRKVSPKERFLFHKTTYRPWYQPYRELALKQGLFDVVFWGPGGELNEGTITNLFLEIDGKLWTPRLEAGLLPGVLREKLLREGSCQERPLFLQDLKRAHRIYVGNAVRGLLPACLVNIELV